MGTLVSPPPDTATTTLEGLKACSNTTRKSSITESVIKSSIQLLHNEFLSVARDGADGQHADDLQDNARDESRQRKGSERAWKAYQQQGHSSATNHRSLGQQKTTYIH